MDALEGTRYNLDSRFSGQGGRGTFPLDVDFSPNGNYIVFDCAVEKVGNHGVIIFKMTITGDNLDQWRETIPCQLNDYLFSPLNPVWR